MNLIYEEPGLVRVEHDAAKRRYITTWSRYNGAHFRKAIGAMLDDIKKNGVSVYIADASQAKDVPTQDDFSGPRRSPSRGC